MPTKREREYYAMGYRDGIKHTGASMFEQSMLTEIGQLEDPREFGSPYQRLQPPGTKPKRKLSAWNKYVKANSKKPRFRYRNGKLNLKKMAIAFRKTPAGRKKK
jgi:hypothetical protein